MKIVGIAKFQNNKIVALFLRALMSYAARTILLFTNFQITIKIGNFKSENNESSKEKAPNVILLDKGLHPRECRVKCSTLKKCLQLKVKTE